MRDGKVLIVTGGIPLKGEVEISGAKNMILPAMAAALLTDETVELKNVPLITDVFSMAEIAKNLGTEIKFGKNHNLIIKKNNFRNYEIPLNLAAKLRASFLMTVPLLWRLKKAKIPNPGGCRIGSRPIERIVEGLRTLGIKIDYHPDDGYFHASVEKLTAGHYAFVKNSHTGTEMLILAAVMAEGETILENSSQEPEVDDLMSLLNQMGARIKRSKPRTIVINGVSKLHGVSYEIIPDRNEAVTFACAAGVTKGDIFVKGAKAEHLKFFLEKLDKAGLNWQEKESGIRFFYEKPLRAESTQTSIYPGFMTDWQAQWALLMTQSVGESTIHETVYEYRFQYVKELKKMGANLLFFNPEVKDREKVYNFNLNDDKPEYFHGLRIKGPTPLHSAVLEIPDLRAGATLVLAGLAAQGQTVIYGVEHLERGYEKFDERLKKLGAKICRQ